MRLSEAIRLGALLKPQAFEHLVIDTPLSELAGLCALAGAALAIGQSKLHYTEFRARWPFTEETARCPKCCPNCHGWDDTVLAMIYHLNDYHRWTREEIADWVAVREQGEPAAVIPVVELVTV